MAQLDDIKTLLQIDDTSQNTLLNYLITMCGEEYKNRTHQESADETIVNAMVLERYNRMGNEGATSMSLSGVSANFESDYSEQVKALIRSKTRLVRL